MVPFGNSLSQFLGGVMKIACSVAAVVAVVATCAPSSAQTSDDILRRLDALEKTAIRAALKQTGGNRTQAAAALGISIRTLRNKLQEYRDAGDPVDVGMESAEA